MIHTFCHLDLESQIEVAVTERGYIRADIREGRPFTSGSVLIELPAEQAKKLVEDISSLLEDRTQKDIEAVA